MRPVAASLLALACLTSGATAQGGGAAAPGSRPSIVERARVDARQDVGFHAIVLPETVYVGQQATYQVGVFLSEEIRARLRRNPQFQPPEVRSTLAYDLASPAGSFTRTVSDRHYDVHVFQRALFPLTTGTHVIPSSRLDYALPLSNSFFAREESHSARTGPLTLVARHPPMEGRPPDYRGAVGQLSVATTLDTRRLRVGDPLTFTVTVDGVANVSLLPRPTLRIAWADVVESGERVELDNSAVVIRGRKDFDWIVTPRQAGAQQLPAVRYPYFNPQTERYEIAITRPESLTVQPGTSIVAERAAADSAVPVTIRRMYAGEVPRPLASRGAYWFVLALAPVPAVALALARRPPRAREPQPMQLLAALTASPTPVETPQLRRAYAAAIAARVQATAAAMSDHRTLVRTLRRAGVTAETAAEADALLSELDAVVFGRVGEMDPQAPRRAHEIVRAIDAEARTPHALAARARVGPKALVVLFPLVAMTAWAARTDPVAESVFREGVAAYDGRRFGEARDAFAELAAARPRSADAWLNLGSASWELTDTAAAVVGWHRALRLQPMARDVRDLLLLTPGPRSGDVPPISLSLIATVGGVLWIAGWALVALAISRRIPITTRPGVAALVTSAVVALGGLRQADLLSGRDRAIVVSPARLRAMPTLGAEAGAETLLGEMTRVRGRQGVWTLIQLADGRRGWLESQRLEVLGVE